MSVNPSGKKQTKHGKFVKKTHRGVGSALILRDKGGGGFEKVEDEELYSDKEGLCLITG